jgi:hypothetical protein
VLHTILGTQVVGASEGVVLQKRWEEHDGREAFTFLFSLGSHSKQAGDKRRLA